MIIDYLLMAASDKESHKSSRRSKPTHEEYDSFGEYHCETTYCEKDCPDCNGTGYDPLDGGQCDRCNGTGIICYDEATGEEF